MQPELWIIAGVNGAGKTTFTTCRKFKMPIVNPDVLPGAPVEQGIAAVKQREALLKAQQSFAVETTATGNVFLKKVQDIKNQGFRINLVYIGLDSAKTSALRVRSRVKSGGHNIAKEDIKRRYPRSMANLPKLMEIADLSLVFDNSTSHAYSLVLHREKGHVAFIRKDLPHWALKAIAEKFFS